MSVEKISVGKKTRKSNWIFLGTAIVVVVVLIAKFGFTAKGEDEEVVQEKSVTASYVETIKLGENFSDAAKLERTATFYSSQKGDVVAENTGRIKVVNFEIGDYVRRGQVLAIFDQSHTGNAARASLDSAQIGLNIALDSQEKTKKVAQESLELAKNARKIAKMQYEDAKNDPDQNEKIAKRSYENAKDLEEQAEQNVKIQKNQAELQVNQASSALNNAKSAYEKTIIKAPVSGKIVSKNIGVDDYISIGSRVGSVVGEGRLEAMISLNADQAKRVKVGDEVEIEIEKVLYKGKIVSMSSIANTTSQRFDLKIATDDKLSNLANKTGRVVLSLALTEGAEDSEETFFAPIDAVNLGQRKTVVFVLEEGKARVREVVVGDVVGDKIEIIKGLSKGEELIVVNSRNLQDGKEVTTKK